MDLRAAVAERGACSQGLVTTRDLRDAGLRRSSLSRAVARGVLIRVRPAVYALTPLEAWPTFLVTHDGVAAGFVQHVRAVLLSLGDGAAASAATAACLRGWGVLHEPLRSVSVAVSHGRSRIRLAGVRPMQRRAMASELLEVREGEALIRVTTAVSTVLDCCRLLPLLDAVVVCDSALRSGQVTLVQLRAAASRLRGHRAAARVRRVLVLCDPQSGSVLESVLRVRMVQNGVVGFATQQVLRDARNRRILRVDFCFAAARLVVETDGSRWHSQQLRDQQLDNRLAAAGWRVLRLSWAEVVHDPDAVLELVHAAVRFGREDFHLAGAAGAAGAAAA